MDIKPGNIFLCQNDQLKIGDFGLATPVENDDRISTGDSRYLAPEALNDAATEASDVFSLGATMMEVAALVEMEKDGPIWRLMRGLDSSSYHTTAQEYLRSMLVRTNYSQSLQSLIVSCMASRPEDRITTDAILKLPEIQEILRSRKENCSEKYRQALNRCKQAVTPSSTSSTSSVSAVSTTQQALSAGMDESEDFFTSPPEKYNQNEPEFSMPAPGSRSHSRLKRNLGDMFESMQE